MSKWLATLAIICATIIACGSAPMWCIPGWLLALLAMVGGRK